VDDHYDVPQDGAYARKVRVWVLPSPTTPDVNLGPNDWTSANQQEFYAFQRAKARARQLKVNGFLDCAPGCTIPGHYDLPVTFGGQTFMAHQAPAVDGNGSSAEYWERVLLRPEVIRAERGSDIEDEEKTLGDMSDPNAVASDEVESMWRRVTQLLPPALVKFFVSQSPNRPPAKAVAMVARLAVQEQDREVRDLYVDLIRIWPDYAEARATEDEVNALLDTDVVGE
jgi:hypothetical protein